MLDKIKQFLEKEGFKLGVYGRGNHSCGRPTGIAVEPNYTPGDGAYTIVVDTERVYTCFLKYPTNYHDWSTTGTRSYSSKEELLKILKELINRSANCWA